jgi:hypothetical protein
VPQDATIANDNPIIHNQKPSRTAVISASGFAMNYFGLHESSGASRTDFFGVPICTPKGSSPPK